LPGPTRAATANLQALVENHEHSQNGIPGDDQMSTFHTECIINRSPEDVFAYLTEFNNQPKWETGVLEAQRTSGPIGVGTQVKKIRQTPTGKIAFTSEITGYDAQKCIFEDVVLDGIAKGSRGRWAVEPNTQGARLSVEIMTKPKAFGNYSCQ
jgi:hypothetical protein